MNRRAVSTVVDVGLALVIVSAAALTLAMAPASEESGDADAADDLATVVATTTAEVEYEVKRPAVTDGGSASPYLLFPPGPGEPSTPLEQPRGRTTGGTVAGLVAEAAVANVRVDGRELSGSTDDFEAAVEATTLDAVADDDVRVQVRAVWRPFPGSGVEGTFVAGDDPPPDADVHAATLDVPGPAAGIDEPAYNDSERGFEELARALAERTVAGLYPPEQNRLALTDTGVRRTIAVERYNRMTVQLHVPTGSPPSSATAANEVLVDALASRFEGKLRDRHDSPAAAAEAASVGTVVVTVRTWSP